MEDLTGQQVKGYILLETIGTGGFGAVYRAEQPDIGREVAIKIILPQYANHPDFIRRFEVEAQVIARLEHPHIIPLYDYWRDPDGAYLVMRYLRGRSLRNQLNESPLALEDAARIIDEMAGALAVAHRHGVIHRDIKPDNILFDEDGNAYLTDFGIAKDLSSDDNVTQADTVVGSPAYLSPEQVQAEVVTGQSDIYTLGLLLYEMLTGHHPFMGTKSTGLLLRHLNDAVPSVRAERNDIPPGVDQVIARATAKDPVQRYADAPALAAALQQVILFEGGNLTTHLTPQIIAAAGLDTLLTQKLDVDNPYKGLEAFEEVDAANFFGRAALIDRIVARLRDQKAGEHFLAVVGPSGSGKSSAVQAGVIPRLRHGTLPGSADWFLVEMQPGAHPLEELEAALLRIAVNPPPSLLAQLKEDERGLLRATKRVLPDDKSELLLFIDQFEEAFTVAKDQAAVTHFLNSIAAAVTDPESRLRVVITMRADFYDRPLLYPAFGNLVRDYSELVLPLTAEELEKAIVGPAQRVGVVPEPGLVNQIISDVSEQPGALPLLQYALTELFEKREGRVMTFAAYQAIGGALGALAREAAAVYARLSAGQQELARQLFLRMVTVTDGSADDTRRRVTQTELASLSGEAEAMNAVIDAFGESRLLTFDRDPQTRERTVAVAHEALIREWAQLRQWLAASREGLLMQRRLQAAMTDWQQAGHDSSYLATGARLAQFESWRSETDIALNEEEADYLRASIERREAQAALEAERQMREKALEQRSRLRLRALVGVMTVAALLSLGLAFLAVNAQVDAVASAEAAATAQAVAETNRVQAEQNAIEAERSANIAATAQAVAEANRVQAEQNAIEAEQSAREARSLALAANARNALADNEPGLALALAIEAFKVFQPPPAEVQQTLAITAYGPNVRYRLQGHNGSVLSVATGGTRAVSVSADGTLMIWNLAQGTMIARQPLPGVAHSVDLSADGRRALLGMFDGDILLWDIERAETTQRFSGHTDVVTRAVFNPSEAQILSVSLDRTLRFWSVETGRTVLEIETPGALLDVALSSDGTRAVAGSADRTLAEGLPVAEQDRTVRVWNLLNGNELNLFDPQSGFVRAVDYSPDGRFVASGTWNSVDGGVIQIWNVRTGRLERNLFGGHEDMITQVKFTADSRRLMSAGRDRRLIMWDIATGIELRHLEGHTDPVLSLAFTPDGKHAISGAGDIGTGTPDPQNDLVSKPGLWLWDLVESRAEMGQLRGHRDWVWSVAISPDGQWAASGSGPLRKPADGRADTSVRVWNLETGDEMYRFEGHTDTVQSLIFTPDSDAILSASWDGTVRQWSLTGGESEGRIIFEGHTGRVLSIDLSVDGKRALTASTDDSIILWDVETGEELQRFEGHNGNVNQAVFNPEETMIASASFDGTVRLWDVASGEEMLRFEGHTAEVTGVAFSPDGKQLLSTSRDATVRLWDVASRERIYQFIGHNQATFGPSFSPDGRTALTGSADQTVRLWDTRTGEQIRQFDSHANGVLATAFSPDGTFALTAAEDNTVRQWLIARTPSELIDWARANRYIPALTCPEREQYRIEPLCEQT